MKIIGINKEKCITCLECVKICPASLYFKPPTKVGDKRDVIFNDPYNSCIMCGHCISICPTNAVNFEDAEKPYEFEGAKHPSSLINYEDLMKVLRSRRSIRRFKSEPVPREDIEAILEAMRYAPSAMNAQSWKYIIITDPQEVEKLRESVIKMMKMARKALKIAKILKPILPKKLKKLVSDPATKISLDKFFERTKNGEDHIFYNAPVVIITYAPVYGSKMMTANDAGIALTYGMLIAQSRNLGTCWIGFAQEALNRFKKNKKLFKIPKKMNVNGVLIVGYPAIKYHRVPPRKPLNVKWYS